MGAFVYSAFGLTLTSDRPVPGLLPAAPGPGPPVHVQFGATPASSPPAGAGRLWYPLPDQAGAEVRARWAAASTFEDAVTYLLGPVLGFVLRLRGRTCLHASAVAVGGQAIALAGSSGAGKSTT